MTDKGQSIISLKFIGLIIVLLIVSEALSFAGFLVPWIGTIIFFVFSGLFLILSLIKIEYGLYILLTELFIGSKGYIFYFNFGGALVSLRLALFLILMAVWFSRLLEGRFKLNFIKSKNFVFYLLLFIVLIWAFVRGILSRNSFDNLFFDANGWLYFALVVVFFDVIGSSTIIKTIFNLLIAAASFLSLKTIFLFYIFSHQIKFLIVPIYRWTRLNLLGEITQLTPFFSRIFLQSQIYLLVVFLIILVFWLAQNNRRPISKRIKPILYLIFILTAILISFSRSYYLGLLVSLLVFLLILKFQYRSPWQKFLISFCLLILIFVFAFSLLYLLTISPSYPEINLFNLFLRRFGLDTEPAALSRWQQLGPLWQAIKQQPIFGSGFGTTVTYQSQDPTVVIKLGGWSTTYAFEWGYLDIWLKMGLAGLMVYLLLIARIFYLGWRSLILSIRSQVTDFHHLLIFGLLLGLIAVLVTNITSPYLNHPLGIGYLICLSAIFEFLREEKPGATI